MHLAHDPSTNGLVSRAVALVLSVLMTSSVLVGIAYYTGVVRPDLGLPLPQGTIKILPLQ